ncbi:hypothetical protein CTEN210_15457 [Chaetoceros tenuissimus]|uniref:Uncharacterized protein n=1 Tax=Chaetoceros tenuissimus TaxID=426638 RepID=A0AAD3HD95_9STRA|nr:hypothetical protein CTEN210_15457 [Chaetoceros tenuissimus]
MEREAAILDKSKNTGLEGNWDPTTHRQFVEAIFASGMQESSPSVIIENMKAKDENITSERVKSRLQKFRTNKEKSVSEFMGTYDDAMEKFAKFVKAKEGADFSIRDIETYNSEISRSEKLLSGEVAAALTTIDMHCPSPDFAEVAKMNELERAIERPPEVPQIQPKKRTLEEIMKNPSEFLTSVGKLGQHSQISVQFPTLTEEEKRTNVGASIQMVEQLFLTLKNEIIEKRNQSANNVLAQGVVNPPMQNGYSSNIQEKKIKLDESVIFPSTLLPNTTISTTTMPATLLPNTTISTTTMSTTNNVNYAVNHAIHYEPQLAPPQPMPTANHTITNNTIPNGQYFQVEPTLQQNIEHPNHLQNDHMQMQNHHNQ